MNDRVAIVTNVHEYAGPPAVSALIQDGFKVLCHSSQFQDAAIRASFGAAHPNQIPAQSQDIGALAAEAIASFRHIDVAVSNDSGNSRSGPIEEKSTEDYRAVLESFAVAPFRLVSSVVQSMKNRGSGRIILITSGAPLALLPNLTLYSAARAATNTMAKALAKELGRDGVAINAIAPAMLLSHYFPGGMDNPEFARHIEKHIPMRRFGRPEEIGALISLLASGTADFISGQVIGFSGGGA